MTDTTAIAATLAELTAGWTPVSGSSEADLTAARGALAQALASDVEPASLGPFAESLRPRMEATPNPEIEALVSKRLAAPGPDVRPFVRSALDDPSALAGSAGMKVAETLGPFADEYGVEHLVDLIPLPKALEIASPAGILALLVVDTIPAPPSPGLTQEVDLGSGSLWIGVRALVGATSAGWVGLAFTKAHVSVVDVVVTPSDSIFLQAGSSLTFELELEHDTPAAAAASVGADATALTVELPAHGTIVFRPSGAELSAVDASSATVYDTHLDATRNADTLRVEAFGPEYLIAPCDVSIATFEVAECLSSDFVLSGAAPVSSAGWALPVAAAPPSLLGAAAGAGVLALELGGGIAAEFGGLATADPLADLALLLDPGRLRVVAHRGARRTTERFLLWGAPSAGSSQAVPPPISHASELDVAYDRDGAVLAVIVPGREEVAAACEAKANVDRPVGASGARVLLRYPAARAGFVDDETAGKRFIVVGRRQQEGNLGQVLALENALVGTRSSTRLVFSGTPAESGHGGRLTISFPLGGIVPTLPDPYAASFATPQLIDTGTSGAVVASLSWAWGETPQLELVLRGTPPAPIRGGGFTLLDVSTHADQFGVAVVQGRESSLAIQAQALATASAELAVYALPGVSWEPVVTDQPPDPVGWQDAFSPDDGPSTLLWAQSVDLVRIEPAIALPHFERAAASTKHEVGAQFTLPFGLTAHLAVHRKILRRERPTFELRRAHYDSGLRDGLQLSILANPKSMISATNPGSPPLDGPALPGYTTTGSPVPPADPSPIYGIQVLGPKPGDAGYFFDQQFTAASDGGQYPGIPVTRIDLSGYGTSMFSDWHHDDMDFTGVVRARFDVLVGRTAYELLVLQSVIVPWSIRITRTIIFDRYDGGLVVKHDTGWKAAGKGRFERLKPDQTILGPLTALENVSNINFVPAAVVPVNDPDNGNPFSFAPVTFDAQAELDTALVGVSAHGATNVPVAATNVAGYAQVSVGEDASGPTILAFMDKLGANGVSGQLGCVLSVGKLTPGTPQFTFNVSSISAAATSARSPGRSYAAAVAVALNGTPRLPHDGAWTIARRGQAASTPTAVDPTTPVPLVRARSGAGPQWRLLEASDAASADDPENLYGILQGVGSAKTFFEHPVIDDLGTALHIDTAHKPKLADVGALLGATDVFPNLGVVLGLDTQTNPLQLVPDGFKQTYDQDVTQPDRTVFELGIVKIVLAYRAPDNGTVQPTHVTLKLDPAASPRWSLDIVRISFEVFVSGFGSDPLLTLYGNFHASETQSPSVGEMQIKYGSALGFVEEIFSGLGPLIKEVGGDVDLEVAFSQNHLTVRDYLAVPQIPLGFGDIHDITLELGFDAQIPSDASFHVGLGSADKPFTWLVSPLSGTGALVLGAAKGDLDVYVEAGIGAGFEIDVAVAQGGASITLDLAITLEGGDISVTAGLLGQAEVSVLGGVASASLTLSAQITLTPIPPPPSFPPDDIDLTAAVAVGIHISICWVIDIDFDGSWQFSQEVPV